MFIVVALIAFTARLAAAEADDAHASALPSRSELAEAEAFDPGWGDADADDDREHARHDAPTRLGRIDLAITWRRTLRELDMRAVDGITSALDPVTTSRGVVWVLLTWTR